MAWMWSLGAFDAVSKQSRSEKPCKPIRCEGSVSARCRFPTQPLKLLARICARRGGQDGRTNVCHEDCCAFRARGQAGARHQGHLQHHTVSGLPQEPGVQPCQSLSTLVNACRPLSTLDLVHLKANT